MRKTLLIALVLILLSLVSAPLCYANSAEPPSILIIVSNAPDDLVISIGDIEARRTDKSFESYYAFYRSDLKSSDNILKVTTESKTFEITLDTPLKSYNNIFTLDLKNQAVTPGKSLSRFITLISLRVVLTLLIEALVFFLFGYRKRKSWLAFLIINLLTQGILNVLLSMTYTPPGGYIIISLIGGEIFVFIAEIIAFSYLVREHSRLRTALFVITANLLSLVAGGYLITVLPV